MIDRKKIKIEISNRHIHLSKDHIDILFGRGYQLKKQKDLSQKGQFSAEEKIILIHNEKRLENVRVLGPPRNQTQIEISKTDSIYLKLNTPLKISGDLEKSAGITIKGPKGSIQLEEGVIIPHRHLHVSNKEAKELGVTNNQVVKVRIPGKKETILHNVIVRAGPEHSLAVHLDSDEGNACFIEKECFGELIID